MAGAGLDGLPGAIHPGAAASYRPARRPRPTTSPPGLPSILAPRMERRGAVGDVDAPAGAWLPAALGEWWRPGGRWRDRPGLAATVPQPGQALAGDLGAEQ
jgi:hypothetical protein